MTENTETGFTFAVHAESIYELRDVLLDASELVTSMFDTANKAVHEKEKRWGEFIRYCNTGRFE